MPTTDAILETRRAEYTAAGLQRIDQLTAEELDLLDSYAEGVFALDDVVDSAVRSRAAGQIRGSLAKMRGRYGEAMRLTRALLSELEAAV